MSSGTRLGDYEKSEVSQQKNFQSEALQATKIGDDTGLDQELVDQKHRLDEAAKAGGDDFSSALESMFTDFSEGDLVRGIVRSVEKTGVLVDIGYKSDAFIANNEFSNDPNVHAVDTLKAGDEVYGVIEKIESKEGYTILSRKKAEYEQNWNLLADLAKEKTPVNVRISAKVDGGLIAHYLGIRGFIPISQLQKDSDEDIMSFVNKDLEVAVYQVDRKRRKVIFSRKGFKNKSKREAISKVLDALKVGQVCDGKVSNVRDFGVFVDIGGIEGLVHISELAWVRVSHPSEIIAEGDETQVVILAIDEDAQRVSLGMKQLVQDPWLTVTEKYQPGQSVEGTVSRIVPFGAFVRLDKHIEGLIHISEISDKRITNIEDHMSVGQKVNAKIIKLIPQEQRIGLSLKDTPSSDLSEQNTEEVALEEN